MAVILVGLSHRSAPVELREKLAFGGEALKGAPRRAAALLEGGEVVVLSTCNRTEIYAAGHSAALSFNNLETFLADSGQIPGESLRPCLYCFRGLQAVHHLFMVTSGLDSMVIGEPQIVSQVKEAYLVASRGGFVGKALGLAFQHALSAARKVHAACDISRDSVSVSSVAVELAKEVLGKLSDRSILVIGAGRMSELTLRSLVEQGANRVTVSNRSLPAAVALAEAYGGEAVRFSARVSRLADADVVIASTSARNYVVSRKELEAVMPGRSDRPLLLLDIAVPRNVEPGAADIPGVFLYNIDDLQEVANRRVAGRATRLKACQRIVAREAEDCMTALGALDLAPFARELVRRAEKVRREQLARLFKGLKGLTDREKIAIGRWADSTVKKVLHQPLRALREISRPPRNRQESIGKERKAKPGKREPDII